VRVVIGFKNLKAIDFYEEERVPLVKRVYSNALASTNMFESFKDKLASSFILTFFYCFKLGL
jgi:hypothetical protein